MIKVMAFYGHAVGMRTKNESFSGKGGQIQRGTRRRA